MGNVDNPETGFDQSRLITEPSEITLGGGINLGILPRDHFLTAVEGPIDRIGFDEARQLVTGQVQESMAGSQRVIAHNAGKDDVNSREYADQAQRSLDDGRKILTDFETGQVGSAVNYLTGLIMLDLKAAADVANGKIDPLGRIRAGSLRKNIACVVAFQNGQNQ